MEKAKEKNYVVNEEEKIVYANVASLTEKQLKAVRNYLALGYTLKEKVKVKEDTDLWKKKTVIAWLEKNATEKQKEDFNKAMNEPVIDKKTNQPKTLKDGKTIKKKGYVAALQYFKKELGKKYLGEEE